MVDVDDMMMIMVVCVNTFSFREMKTDVTMTS